MTLVGKALFGRERFAFEVQEMDYSPAFLILLHHGFDLAAQCHNP